MPKPSQHISHFLIGIPASGKSTFACWLQRQTGAMIISTDQIRDRLYGDVQIQGHWPDIEAVVLTQISQAIAQHQPVIYDATNTNHLWRNEFLQRCPPLTWLAWYLDLPVQLCLARNQRRSRQVPPAIIQHMANELAQDPPKETAALPKIITVKNIDEQTLKALKKQHLQYLGD
ncbi:MAG: AAA family ATPase [Limnothrix sp.]